MLEKDFSNMLSLTFHPRDQLVGVLPGTVQILLSGANVVGGRGLGDRLGVLCVFSRCIFLNKQLGSATAEHTCVFPFISTEHVIIFFPFYEKRGQQLNLFHFALLLAVFQKECQEIQVLPKSL